MKLLKLLTLSSGLLVMVLMWFSEAGFFINISTSYPCGLYRALQSKKARTTYKGSLVLVCPDTENPVIQKAGELNILPSGTFCGDSHAPLIKRLVGVPGDRISVTRDGILINAMLLPNSMAVARVFIDLKVSADYDRILKGGEYWVMSEYSAQSFDSRYFGPVKTEQIRHPVRPIFTR